MLTARRRVEDRVVGLAQRRRRLSGQAIRVSELRARVAALLRRPSRLRTSRRAPSPTWWSTGDALEAIVDGSALPLTRKQFELLELLARRKNHMTPKRMIEEALYGFDDEVSANSIEAQVSKLRRALRRPGRSHASRRGAASATGWSRSRRRPA